MNDVPKNAKQIQAVECACQKTDGLFIPNRQVSAIIAFACFLFLAIFLGGYFLGKQHMVDQFVAKAEQDSFADQIYTSLCALYDQDPADMVAKEEVKNDSEQLVADASNQGEAMVQPHEAEEVAEVAEVTVAENQEIIEPELPAPSSMAKYYAQLIGFGTKKAAEQFVKKQARKQLSMVIQPRESITAKGKKIAWYQVETARYADRDVLEKLIDRIAKEEKLKGVKIVTC